jgi:hypothetical protein
LVRNQSAHLRKIKTIYRETLKKDQRKMLKEQIDEIRKNKDREKLKEGPRNNNNDKSRKKNEN